jgi:hypothetical protein
LRGQGCVTAGPSTAILGDIMSRGHGKWEQFILEGVELCPHVYGFPLMALLLDEKQLHELGVQPWMPPINTRDNPSAVRALRRAASNLIRTGRVGHWYCDFPVPAYERRTGVWTTRRVKKLYITKPTDSGE